MAKAGLLLVKDKRRLGQNENLKEELKHAQNRYFWTIKKAKQECWQKFLQEESQSPDSIIDKNYCWTAIKYTKPLQFKTILIVKYSDRNMTLSIKDKKALVKRLTFSKPPTNLIKLPVISFGLAHIIVTKELVVQASMTQVATKAPNPDKINFQILYMIWGWDKIRIISIVYHAIQLGHYPME